MEKFKLGRMLSQEYNACGGYQSNADTNEMKENFYKIIDRLKRDNLINFNEYDVLEQCLMIGYYNFTDWLDSLV